MYLCVSGIVTKPVSSQESERSCICVLVVALPSLYQARKVNVQRICVLVVSILLLSMILIFDFVILYDHHMH